MGVPPVMDKTIVTNLFFHQNKRLGFVLTELTVLLCVISLSLGGCEKISPDTEVVWGKSEDVTEDLYHRLQAGIFELDKDPYVCEIVIDFEKRTTLSQKFGLPFKHRAGADKMTHISWERGSFWVKSDDHALVVFYLDAEAAYSHIQVAPIKGFQLVRQFSEHIRHPVR